MDGEGEGGRQRKNVFHVEGIGVVRQLCILESSKLDKGSFYGLLKKSE